MQRISSFYYFSSGIHSENSGIKTTWEIAMHVFPLLQFCRYASEKDILSQDQLDTYEDVKGLLYQQGLSYVTEII